MNRTLPEKVAVVGLGYVGLSLAVALARALPTIGFDISTRRVEELSLGCDINNEATLEELREPLLSLTSDPSRLSEADFIIVAVPTPVDEAKLPDLTTLIQASEMVGKAIADINTARSKALSAPFPVVVFESTVYPGCTEEICIPALERASGLQAGRDFSVGYSPERINPGDRDHDLTSVVKIVAGMDNQTTEMMARVYGTVVKAGTHRAPDLRTAEAAKVIENVQRDLNIALMNELSMLFNRLGLDTNAVLEAAKTKWNFVPFTPGLVGGHCIPVDPYYLTFKAQEIGYHPEVILAGRRINDSMSFYLANQAVTLLAQAGKPIKSAKLLVLGLTFKEDTRDLRNSRIMDTIHEVENYGLKTWVHDPIVGHREAESLGLRSIEDPFGTELPPRDRFDAIMLAVPHSEFKQRSIAEYKRLMRNNGSSCVLLDVKRALQLKTNKPTTFIYWSL